MILPNTKSYSGVTTISQGWITIRDENALGPYSGASVGDTASPAVTVMNGAALHLMPGFATITGVAWSAGARHYHDLVAARLFWSGNRLSSQAWSRRGLTARSLSPAITSTSFTYDLAVNPGVASTFGTAAGTATRRPLPMRPGPPARSPIRPRFRTDSPLGQTVSIMRAWTTAAYNGVFVITSVPTTTTFTVGLLLDPGVATTLRHRRDARNLTSSATSSSAATASRTVTG